MDSAEPSCYNHDPKAPLAALWMKSSTHEPPEVITDSNYNNYLIILCNFLELCIFSLSIPLTFTASVVNIFWEAIFYIRQNTNTEQNLVEFHLSFKGDLNPFVFVSLSASLGCYHFEFTVMEKTA